MNNEAFWCETTCHQNVPTTREPNFRHFRVSVRICELDPEDSIRIH